MSPKKDTQKSNVWTDEEKAAMKERAKEMKAEARASKNRQKAKKRCLQPSKPCPNQTTPWRSASMRSSQPPHPTSCQKPGTVCPPMPIQTARSFASFRRRANSMCGMQLSASSPMRSLTTAICGRRVSPSSN